MPDMQFLDSVDPSRFRDELPRLTFMATEFPIAAIPLAGDPKPYENSDAARKSHWRNIVALTPFTFF
jgi:hypothetical protein